jgi:hypothetical protein
MSIVFNAKDLIDIPDARQKILSSIGIDLGQSALAPQQTTEDLVVNAPQIPDEQPV